MAALHYRQSLRNGEFTTFVVLFHKLRVNGVINTVLWHTSIRVNVRVSLAFSARSGRRRRRRSGCTGYRTINIAEYIGLLCSNQVPFLWLYPSPSVNDFFLRMASIYYDDVVYASSISNNVKEDRAWATSGTGQCPLAEKVEVPILVIEHRGR